MKNHPSRVLIRPFVCITFTILQNVIDLCLILDSNRTWYIQIEFRDSIGSSAIFRAKHWLSFVSFSADYRRPSIVHPRKSSTIRSARVCAFERVELLVIWPGVLSIVRAPSRSSVLSIAWFSHSSLSYVSSRLIRCFRSHVSRIYRWSPMVLAKNPASTKCLPIALWLLFV